MEIRIYNRLQFRTETHAHWAAFFDLVKWLWWTNPQDVGGWDPDFRVESRCPDPACNHRHCLLVSVLPIGIEHFAGHPCLDPTRRGLSPNEFGAAFGVGPEATKWYGYPKQCMANPKIDTVASAIANSDQLWIDASNILLNQSREAENAE